MSIARFGTRVLTWGGTLTGVVALTGGLLGSAPTASAVTPATIDYLATWGTSTPFDVLSQGGSSLYASPRSYFRLSGGPRGQSVTVATPVTGPRYQDTVTIDLSWQDGTARTGAWTDVPNSSDTSAVPLRFAVSNSGRACNTSQASVWIRDIHLGADGVPDRLWLAFDYHCEGHETVAMGGELRIGVASDAPVTAVPSVLPLPDSYPGVLATTARVWLLGSRGVAGTLPRVTAASAQGPHPLEFPVAATPCLTGPCAVDVGFRPASPGARAGTVVVETDRGRVSVPTTGVGVPGTTSFVWGSSGTDDYIAQGLTRSGTLPFIGARGRNDKISFSGGDGGRIYANGEIQPGNGRRLTPGRYEVPWSGETLRGYDVPDMSVSGEGRGCGYGRGSFEIHKATYDAAGELTSLVLTFTQYCQQATSPLTGTFRWHDLAPGEVWVTGPPTPPGWPGGAPAGPAPSTTPTPSDPPTASPAPAVPAAPTAAPAPPSSPVMPAAQEPVTPSEPTPVAPAPTEAALPAPTPAVVPADPAPSAPVAVAPTPIAAAPAPVAPVVPTARSSRPATVRPTQRPVTPPRATTGRGRTVRVDLDDRYRARKVVVQGWNGRRWTAVATVTLDRAAAAVVRPSRAVAALTVEGRTLRVVAGGSLIATVRVR